MTTGGDCFPDMDIAVITPTAVGARIDNDF